MTPKAKADTSSLRRLQVILREAGVASRRRAEEFIRAGRVTVNGSVVTELGSKVRASDDILVDGRRVSAAEEKRLYLFFKPKGVVSTMRDPQGRRSLAEFTRGLPVKVFPVGRLDRDASGLLLLTNDGALAHLLLHPRFQSARTYWCRVEGKVTPKALRQLEHGVALGSRAGCAVAARLLRRSPRAARLLGQVGVDESAVEITAAEGRKHFIKRLLAAVGHPVRELCRVRHGEYELGELQPGEIRPAGRKRAPTASEAVRH